MSEWLAAALDRIDDESVRQRYSDLEVTNEHLRILNRDLKDKNAALRDEMRCLSSKLLVPTAAVIAKSVRMPPPPARKRKKAPWIVRVLVEDWKRKYDC